METIDGSSSGSQFFKLFGTSTEDEISKSIGGIVSLSQRNSPSTHNWDVNDLLGPWPTGNNINSTTTSTNNNVNNNNNNNNNNMINNNNLNNINSNSNNINSINNSRGFHGNPCPLRNDGSSFQAPGSKTNCSIDSYNIGSSLLSRKGLTESKLNCDGLWSTNDLFSPLSDSSYNSLLSTSTSLSKGLEPCINTNTSNTTSSSSTVASCFDNVTLNHHHIQRNDLASSISLNLNGNNKSSYLFPPLVKGNGNCLYDIEPGTSICHSNAVNVATSRRGTLSSHYASSSSSSSIVDSPRIHEDEFESQIAKIANEIHSTIQLHMSGLQIRREQLLQQLENVKRIYLQLFKQQQQQQQSSPSSPSTGSSCSSGSHNIEGNGLGGGFNSSNNGNTNSNNGHRRIGFNQSRPCYDSNSEIGGHSLPIPSVTFNKPDSALLKAVSSLGFLTTPAFAPCCSATGDGLEVAVPGLNNNFTIVTRNCFNEELLVGRENIFVKIVPSFNSSSSSTTQNSSSASSPSSSGSLSPLICASIYGAGNGNGNGGNGGNCHGVKDVVKDILGLDIGSNSSNSNNHNQHLGSSQSSTLNIPYTLLDHNNGKYTVTYLVPQSRTLPSELIITVLVNCIPLNESPFHVPVQLEQRSRWRLGLTFGSEGNAIGQLCRPWGVAIVRMPPFMLTPQYLATSSIINNGGGGGGIGTNGCGENINNATNSSSSINSNHYNSTSTGNSCSSSSLTGNQVTSQTCSNIITLTTTTTGMTVGSGNGNHQQQSQQQQKQVNQQFGCDKIPQSLSSGHLQSTNQSTTQHLQTNNSLSGQSTTGNSYTSFFSSDNSIGNSLGNTSTSIVGLSMSTNNSNVTATNSITGIESSSCASSSLSSSTGPGPNTNRNGSKSTTISKNHNKHYLIAVADRSNNRIQLLHFDAGSMSIKVIQVFGSGPGTRAGLFDRPAGITINTSLNHIIVADKDNHRIQVFDLSGRYQFKFGEKGNRAGQFCYPWDVDSCSHTHQILVSDTRNRRVQLFTPYGQYITHFSHPLDSPRGVSFLGDNRIVVSDFNKHRLLIFDKFPSKEDASKVIGFGEGTGWGEFLRPQGISILGNSIFCADSRNNRICIYNLFTQSFEYLGQDLNCDRPSGLHVIDNILVIVDFGNNRLQICQR
ncbi:probable serine/threonine-protein kinase ndrD [Panonychus citri]|uniref:probable serine/threonine-protein kinase ndrD n=1 Tax=Panonychus citri TaxID=50023 RepID=UPI002307C452|nr:probable serine/threonine-protein kinase ndrD [Panonychus citri]